MTGKEIRLNVLEQCNPSFQAFGLFALGAVREILGAGTLRRVGDTIGFD